MGATIKGIGYNSQVNYLLLNPILLWGVSYIRKRM